MVCVFVIGGNMVWLLVIVYVLFDVCEFVLGKFNFGEWDGEVV